jgi:hypothetical protein
MDKLFNIVIKKGAIAGSVGDDIKNNTDGCCNNISIWNKIIPNNNNKIFLNKMHVLNSWFIFKKCEINNIFINEWVFFTCYKDSELNDPLVTYHHTVDQSIFNILVIKHHLPVFYSKNIKHSENKNKNTVLNIINNASNTDKLFIYL